MKREGRILSAWELRINPSLNAQERETRIDETVRQIYGAFPSTLRL